MKKIRAEIYSRVVGYFRPLKQWNPGKQSEFRDRKPFKINKEILEKKHDKKNNV